MELGNWYTTYTRFKRWGKAGVWKEIVEAVSGDRNLEALMIDSTVVRAHQHASGAAKRRTSRIGRSRGGLSSKIHVAVDARGNPVRWLLTREEESDMNQGLPFIKGFEAKAILADKGYDSNVFVDYIHTNGMLAVIPPKKNRLVQREYDRHLYKDRNSVERFFNRIKQFRRLATRHEKLDRNFLSFINLVFAYLWIY
ncbi:IS5 family transposase [Undibacterium sp. SXout7W]|uniref:IS5 family transposase n=1 Tax=Undibacterium sp. SXout7W TaxID=3413049 RepID=UPI003BEFA75C